MSRNLKRSLTGLMLLGLLALPAAAQQDSMDAMESVEVRVLPQAEVVGAEFTLGEVAEFDGFDLETLKKLSRVSLGRSPLPGRSLVLSVSFLASRLAEVVPPERLRLHVPPGAQVMRATQRISGREVAEQVLKLAAAQSGEQDGALEIGRAHV